MTSEKSIDKARERAFKLEGDDKAKQAMSLLMRVAEQNPNSWTVQNLICDDILRIGKQNGYWDEVVLFCRQQAEHRRSDPEGFEYFTVEGRAGILDKEARHIEAIELRADYARKWPLPYGGRMEAYADKLVELGAHDQAWRLCNEAVALTLREGVSLFVAALCGLTRSPSS